MKEGNFPPVQSNLPVGVVRVSQVADRSKDLHTRVNDDTRDRGSVTSDPFGGTVHYANVREIPISPRVD